jgi:hypothetical protein
MIVSGVISASWPSAMVPSGGVAAVVHHHVVVLAEADQVLQAGPAAVAPVLDVVQVDPAGLTAGEPAATVVAFAGRTAQCRAGSPAAAA